MEDGEEERATKGGVGGGGGEEGRVGTTSLPRTPRPLAQRPSRRQRLPATAKSQALAPSAFLARSHRLSPPPTEDGGSRAGRGRTLSEIDNSPRSVGARGLRAGRKISTEAPRRQHIRTVRGSEGPGAGRRNQEGRAREGTAGASAGAPSSRQSPPGLCKGLSSGSEPDEKPPAQFDKKREVILSIL